MQAALQYPSTRAVARQVRRARANARVTVPIPASVRARDPLRTQTKIGAALVLLFVIGAIVAHIGVIGALWLGGSAIRALNPDVAKVEQRVELTIIEPPPPPPPPPPVEPEPEPEPEAAPKPKPKPKVKLPPPPPDPIDVPKDLPPPPPPSDKPPPRRLVGLSLGSTVKGGSGPSFALGNTRMGRTAKTAADAKDVKPLPKTAAPKRVNRAATHVPTDGRKLVQPEVKGPKLEPAYPKAYEAQGLAGKVVLELRIGKDGRVMRAKVIKPSPHPEFNESALRTAKRQRFTAAYYKGQPDSAREFTISWTVYFEVPVK